METMFGSSLPPVVNRKVLVLFTLLVFVCMQLYPTHVVLCLCFVCLRLVSCVPCEASYSGLSISDCPFGILERLYNVQHKSNLTFYSQYIFI